jgi:hypothetical protein
VQRTNAAEGQPARLEVDRGKGELQRSNQADQHADQAPGHGRSFLHRALRLGHRPVIVFQRHQRQAIRVFVITLLHRVEEEKKREAHKQQTQQN